LWSQFKCAVRQINNLANSKDSELQYITVFTMVNHFVSFGAGRRAYGSALKRLRKEIIQLDPEARVWLFDDSCVGDSVEGLGQPFLDFARDHPRGFGYWVWKPWVVLEVMKNAQEGDIVFYLDVGCTVHTSEKSRLRYGWYQDCIRKNGSLFFQEKFLEYSWTKKEVAEHFHLSEQHLATGQIISGIHGYLVNATSHRFIQEWLNACTLDSGRLVVDVESSVNEDKRFVEHRHDQSVLSCLVKSKGLSAVPDESFYYPHWNRDGDDVPFWATRKISGIPSWMGYYAPRSWPFVLKSRLTKKPLTKLVDPDYLAKL
jgi:hypothetical protein